MGCELFENFGLFAVFIYFWLLCVYIGGMVLVGGLFCLIGLNACMYEVLWWKNGFPLFWRTIILKNKNKPTLFWNFEKSQNCWQFCEFDNIHISFLAYLGIDWCFRFCFRFALFSLHVCLTQFFWWKSISLWFWWK